MAEGTGRRGRPPHPDILTPAEWLVLEHLREGKTNAEIAVRLGISPDGVKFHVSNMLAKLELPDRQALAKWDGSRTSLRHRTLARLPVGQIASPLALKIGAGLAALVVVVAGTLSAVAWWERGDSESIPDALPSLEVHSLDIQLSSLTNLGPPGQASVQQVTVHSIWVAGQGMHREVAATKSPTITTELVATASGVFSWSLPPPEGITATQVEKLPYPAEAFIPPGLSTAQPPPSLRDVVSRLARGGRARLVGEDTIAGHPAYRIEISPGSCAPILPNADGLQTYWLDKETFTVLGQTIADESGHIVLQQRATSVAYNTQLDPIVFSVPADAEVTPSHATSIPLTPTNDICSPSGFTTMNSDVSTGPGAVQPVASATGVAEATVQVIPNATRVVTAVPAP